MPRTKGSKNKPAMSLDDQIAAAQQRVEKARAAYDAAAAELENLKTLRDEEQVKALMSAIAQSGKSVSDVIAMIKKED